MSQDWAGIPIEMDTGEICWEVLLGDHRRLCVVKGAGKAIRESNLPGIESGETEKHASINLGMCNQHALCSSGGP